jgi:nucleoside-diphosphate-sugar epimerase
MLHKYQKLLVTGGAGFIGSHIVDRLLNEGLGVTVIDNLDTGSLKNIAHHQDNKEFRFIKGDIRDFNLVKKTMKDIDAVFHEAALANVSLSVQNPVLANDVNVAGTLNLLKTSLDLGVKRFIYASSAAVYGYTPPDRKSEDMTTDPVSPYGVSKLAAEYYVRLFHKLYNLNTVSLRYFNVYGPRQRCDIGCNYGGVIAIFIRKLLENMPLMIYGDGEQTRDFVYVQDVIEANMLALKNRNAIGQVFNIGTGRRTSINRLAELLKEIMGKRHIRNTYADPRPSDLRHGYAGTTKAEKILGYNSRFSLKEGLVELLGLDSKDGAPALNMH